jgi:fructosamine-3-kinase
MYTELFYDILYAFIIQVFDQADGGSALVMEYLDMGGLRKHSATLGTQLAR